ncbi:unnamed protein product, partial [Ectocarpus sp. 12 AP-2014]
APPPVAEQVLSVLQYAYECVRLCMRQFSSGTSGRAAVGVLRRVSRVSSDETFCRVTSGSANRHRAVHLVSTFSQAFVSFKSILRTIDAARLPLEFLSLHFHR